MGFRSSEFGVELPASRNEPSLERKSPKSYFSEIFLKYVILQYSIVRYSIF